MIVSPFMSYEFVDTSQWFVEPESESESDEEDPVKLKIKTYFVKNSYMPPIMQRSIQQNCSKTKINSGIIHVKSAGILQANKKKVIFNTNVTYH